MRCGLARLGGRAQGPRRGCREREGDRPDSRVACAAFAAAGGGCDGIDLNRNFGYKWGGKGASPQPCQEIFRGASAFSEPETNAIQSFVLSKKGSLKSYLSFHSYGQYVLYPWGYDRFVPPDHQDLQRVGTKMANAMRATSGLSYTVGSSAALLYPASGTADWTTRRQYPPRRVLVVVGIRCT